MNIQLNGQKYTLPTALTVSELIEHLKLGDQAVAIEVDSTIIPRSQHTQTTLCEGQAIEIVHAIGGG